MKMLIILFLLLLLVSSAFGELTKDDLRTIIDAITASEKRMKEYIDLKIDAVEKNLNTKIDALDKNLNDKIDSTNTRIDELGKNLNDKIEASDKNLDDRIGFMRLLLIALIGLIAAAIVVPPIIIEYRSQKEEYRSQKEVEKRQADFQTELRQLREKVEAMENTPS